MVWKITSIETFLHLSLKIDGYFKPIYKIWRTKKINFPSILFLSCAFNCYKSCTYSFFGHMQPFDFFFFPCYWIFRTIICPTLQLLDLVLPTLWPNIMKIVNTLRLNSEEYMRNTTIVVILFVLPSQMKSHRSNLKLCLTY